MERKISNFELGRGPFSEIVDRIGHELLDPLPSLPARLGYLSSLLNRERSVYSHPQLSRVYGEEIADLVLPRSHQQTFVLWLREALQRQRGSERSACVCEPGWTFNSVYVAPPEFVPRLRRAGRVRENQLCYRAPRVFLALLQSEINENDREFPNISTDGRVDTVLEFANQHFGRTALRLSEIATQLRVSEHYLGLLFRKQLGIGFHLYLRAIRMKKAAELLGDLRLTIQEVSAFVGYSNQSNFTHDFRSTFGTTPKRFRNQSCQITISPAVNIPACPRALC